MKSFGNFLSEATKANSLAIQQADRMGLKSDGHGGWYDERGEFVAKTVGDKLEFYNKDSQPGEKDRDQTDKEKTMSAQAPDMPVSDEAKAEKQAKDSAAAAAATAGTPAAAVQGEVSAKNAKQAAATDQAQAVRQTAPADVPKTKGTLTIAFGRFNPPTTGHEKLLNTVASKSDDGDYIIIPSRSEDKKKNPLGADRKAALMRQMYPDHAERIVNDTGNRTIFDVLTKAHNDGYANVRVVGGGDRVKEFEKLTNKYNGSTYQFDNIEVISAGERDPDGEGVEGMSASKMRKAASEDDFRAFRKGLPKSIDNDTAIAIFREVQGAMGIEYEEEAAEEWEIAPRLNLKALRENYVADAIFNIGDSIVHDATGMIAEIVRKGTNYLICVSEDQKMFKAWTQDVSESGSAASTPKEREVGTDSLRSFLQRLTPGEKVQSYINKNKKPS